MDWDKIAADFVNSSPTWGPFLAALIVTFSFMRYLVKVLVSNGLTQAVNKLGDRIEDMPEKTGNAVALRLMDLQVKIVPPTVVQEQVVLEPRKKGKK